MKFTTIISIEQIEKIPDGLSTTAKFRGLLIEIYIPEKVDEKKQKCKEGKCMTGNLGRCIFCENIN